MPIHQGIPSRMALLSSGVYDYLVPCLLRKIIQNTGFSVDLPTTILVATRLSNLASQVR